MNEIEAIVELQAEILAVRGPFHIGSVIKLSNVTSLPGEQTTNLLQTPSADELQAAK